MSDTTVHGVEIVLEGVTKRYLGQQQPAVDNITLTVPAGQIVVLVGPSGCGKTTTMKMINRLIEPTDGRITIGGEDVRAADADQLRRRIGYVIQSGGLFPHMSVAGNIALVPRMLGWEKSRITARTDELLDLVGLDPAKYRDRYPRQLSGGQQQRIGVARALAADPPVLLMDEPFGAVDPITRSRLQDELLRLQEDLGKTIVFVTHDFDEAVKLGDRIAVLREGSRIAQYDTPAEILASPADDFVADFVGAGASLKQLTLTRVSEVPPVPFPTATEDEPAEAVLGRLRAEGLRCLLVLDPRGRPARWVYERDLVKGHCSLRDVGQPVRESVALRATLNDALDAMLSGSSAVAPVTGRRGEYVGVITVEQVMSAIQQARTDESAPVGPTLADLTALQEVMELELRKDAAEVAS